MIAVDKCRYCRRSVETPFETTPEGPAMGDPPAECPHCGCRAWSVSDEMTRNHLKTHHNRCVQVG